MTTLTIISEIHKASENYSVGDLVEILVEVNPDLILREHDSSFFTKDYEMKNSEPSKWMAQQAVLDFLKLKQVKQRPFDIEGRNKFYRQHDYHNKRKEYSHKSSELYESNKLAKEYMTQQELSSKLYYQQMELLQKSGREINSSEFNELCRKRSYVMYEQGLEMIKSTPDLQEHLEFWELVCEEWERRNKTMAANILYWIEEFPNKHMVVLVGAAHKYFLLDELLPKQKEVGFVIKEFWD